MSYRLLNVIPAVALMAGFAFTAPAQAGVSWSIGINAPIAPGVAIGTVIGGGHGHGYIAAAPIAYAPAPVYMPPPVVYEPAPIYVPPPVVYAPPVYAPPVVYGPPAVVVAPRPYYHGYRPPVVVRPAYGWHEGWREGWRDGPHDGWRGRGVPPPVSRGGYGPMADARGDRTMR